jgi:hypothetical protein
MPLENFRRRLDRLSAPARRLAYLRTAGAALYAVALPLFLLYDFLWQIWQSGAARAWDGTGHYGIAQVYDQHIFPDTFGWTPAHFAGMPFPNFYPPLFFWCVSFLHHTQLFSFDTAFKLMVIVPVLLAPAAMWLLAWTVSDRDRVVAFCVALLSLIPLVSTRFGGHLDWSSGLDYYSTFAVGMYTQPLGFILLIAWYVAYVRAQRAVWRFALACVLLALAVLANYLNGISSALFIAATLLFDLLDYRRAAPGARRAALRALVAHFVSPLVAAGLALFWLVPMFGAYDYLVTRPFTLVVITQGMIVWFAAAALGTLFWLRRPSAPARPYVATCFVLAGILIFAAQVAPRWYPLQANRLAPTLNFLLAVPVAYALVVALRMARSLAERRFPRLAPWGKTLMPYATAVVLLALAGYAFRASLRENAVFFFRTLALMSAYPAREGQPLPEARNEPAPGEFPREFEAVPLPWISPKALRDMFQREHSSDPESVARAAATVEHLLRFAAGRRDGRYLVELPDRYLSELPSFDAHALNSYLGAQGNETLTVIYREASPNSLFMYPQANALSYNPDNFGLSSVLADDLDFAEQPTAKHLERARLLGTKYLVVYTARIKERLAAEPAVGARHDFGDWSVFELRDAPPPVVRALAYKPALVVSELTLKGRYSNESNFIRFAEEQFFDGWFDVLLVRSPTMKLDELGSLAELRERFGALILDAYDCDRCDLVYRQLRAFSQTRPLLLLADDNSLFNRIRSAGEDFPLARVIERQPEGEGVWLSNLGTMHRYGSSPARREWAQIRAALEEHKVPTEAAAVGGRLAGDSIQLDYQPPPPPAAPPATPVLISATYHPNWRALDGSTIYPANPMFMLVFVRQPTSLEFARRPLDTAGLWATAVTLLAVICFTVWSYRRSLTRRLMRRRRPAPEVEEQPAGT